MKYQPPRTSGRPDTERLHATVARVVEELSPQQIVLFGSAAREDMHPGSDIDLLVIRERLNGEPKTEQKRRRAAGDGSYEADLVVMDRATAEAGRDSITKVQGIALEEGRTIYTRPDVEPVLTGPTYCWNGAEMVKKTKFEPEEATRLVEDAEETWKIANMSDLLPRHRCRELHLSIEYALKALTIAQGRRVTHTHTLNELWDTVEADGENIRATQDRKALDTLTLYGGRLKYESPTPETDPVETWRKTKPIAEDVLNHAKARVPALVEETSDGLE